MSTRGRLLPHRHWPSFQQLPIHGLQGFVKIIRFDQIDEREPAWLARIPITIYGYLLRLYIKTRKQLFYIFIFHICGQASDEEHGGWAQVGHIVRAMIAASASASA